MPRPPKRVRVLRLAGCVVMMSTLTFAGSSHGQDLGSSLGTGGALNAGGSLEAIDPLQPGIGQTLRSPGLQAGNQIDDPNTGQVQGAAGLRAANSQMGGQRMRMQGPMLGVSVQPAERGVLVTDVRAGTAAEQAGVQRNDVIVGVNGQSIQSRQALIQAVRASAGGKMIVNVIRDGQSQPLTAMISQDDSTYRVARPVIDANQNNGSVSSSYEELRQHVTKLRKDLAALRQEVNALNATGNDRSLLNNTPSTPLDTAPVDVAAPGATATPVAPAAAADDADATDSNDDLFGDN
jgi:membrane-associated protease RseP (regulator of RpoE activity)